MYKYSFLILFTLSINSFGQNLDSVNVTKAFNEYLNNNPKEKAYLHTDKEIYIQTEAIWFKMYVLNFDKLTNISNIGYVLLMDNNNKILEKKMFELKKGMCNGNFDLPASLPNGNYKLSCYTTWMLNNNEFVFEKTIKIQNKNLKSPTTISKKSSLKFYSESGSFINDIDNKIAIKAIDEFSKPISIEGAIFNSKDSLIQNFKTDLLGICIISLKPTKSEKYFGKIGIQKLAFPLPAQKDEGVILKVNNKNENKLFLSVDRGLINEHLYNDLIIIGTQNNKIILLSNFNFDEGILGTTLNKSVLNEGIVQFTIFTKSGKALAERLVFNYSKNKQTFCDSLFSLNDNARSINKLNLHFYNSNSFASASIVDFKSQNKVYGDNIFLSMLLTSDLRGLIPAASEIFVENHETSLNNLEGIMLTNGWRTFDWQKIITNKYDFLNYYPETSIGITGRAINKKNNAPFSKKNITLSLKGEDSTKYLAVITTDLTGGFYVPNLNFLKKATVKYNFSDPLFSDAFKIDIIPSYFDTLKKGLKNNKVIYNFIENLNPILPNTNLYKLTPNSEEIIVKTKVKSKEQILEKRYVSPFYEGGRTLVPDESFGYIDIFDMILNIVPGARVYRDPENVGSVTVTLGRGAFSNSFSSTTTSNRFFLNEIPIDPDVLGTINPNDVALLKLYTDGSSGVSGLDGGGLSIYTKKDSDVNPINIVNETKSYIKNGFSYSRIYDQPNWLNVANGNVINKNTIADNRTTLLWEPNINIDLYGNAVLKFANADNCKSIKVCIQGVTNDGKLLYQEINF